MLTIIENFLKENSPPKDKLILFYWGTYVAFLGAILYLGTHYLFFLWTPGLLYMIYKGLKTKNTSFWSLWYFIMPTLLLTTIVLSILC